MQEVGLATTSHQALAVQRCARKGLRNAGHRDDAHQVEAIVLPPCDSLHNAKLTRARLQVYSEVCRLRAVSPVEALVALSLRWVPCTETQTPEVCAAHREAIAVDALAAAATDPLPRRGVEGTAVLMMATASLESRFDDNAVSRTGDVCTMQVHPIGAERIDTRADCMRVALSRMHWSWITCGATGHRDWLAPYTTGRCFNEQRDARARLARAATGWVTYKKLTSPRALP